MLFVYVCLRSLSNSEMRRDVVLMFLLPLLYALTMNLKTKKVPEYFFWKLQIVLVELYNHYWPWNKNGEEVDYKIREKERKTRDTPWSKPQKKQKVSLKRLERTQRVRGEGLERVAYDPKSVGNFGGIVE